MNLDARSHCVAALRELYYAIKADPNMGEDEKHRLQHAVQDIQRSANISNLYELFTEGREATDRA